MNGSASQSHAIRIAVAIGALALVAASRDASAQGIGAADAPAQSVLDPSVPTSSATGDPSTIGTASAGGSPELETSNEPGQDNPIDSRQRIRIETACLQARRPDWGHIAMGGTMVVVGALGYIPNALDSQSARPDYTALGGGIGLGLMGGGLILALRPYSAGAMRLVMTCELIAGPRRGNPRTLRAAERYLNAVADAQRDWSLRAGLVAAGVTILGVTLSALLFQSPRDKFFWSGVFAAVPLAFWLDLLAPSPAIRASLRFRTGGFSVRSIGPMVFTEGGGGVGLGGAF